MLVHWEREGGMYFNKFAYSGKKNKRESWWGRERGEEDGGKVRVRREGGGRDLRQ
jgi:hypothetical protein